MIDLKENVVQEKLPALYNSEFSRDELIAILDTMQDTFYRTDLEGNLIYLSKSLDTLLGYQSDEVLGTKMSDYYVDPEGRLKFLTKFQASNGNVEGYEAALRHKDGHTVWVSTNAHYFRGKDGEILGIEGTTRDVTARIVQQQELNRLKTTLDKTLDCVFMFDPETLIFFYVNEGVVKQIGYSAEELLLMKAYDIKPAYDKNTFKTLIEPLINNEKDSITIETFHQHKDGHELLVEIFLQYIQPENETPRFVAIVRDLSERIEAQEKLLHLAHHDALTNLPNRVLFMDRLEHALSRRKGTGQLSVLFLDLDRFKNINDTLGHAIGDKVLQLLSKRLSTCVRKSDTLARLSGDEFAIILEDIKTNDEIIPVARNIIKVMVEPFTIEGHELFVTTSIGISISPNDGDDSHTLLKHADIAMYRAKDLGRNTYQFYSSDMSSKAFERLNLETSLRYALEREQFKLVYQPQVDVSSNKVIGVEVLLRWQHPDLGLVGPHDFIPLLEDTGLIVPVGEWVLRNACVQVKTWQKKYNDNLRLSINLSARQFNDSNLVSIIDSCLEQTKLPAVTLELEITEGVIMQDKKWISGAFHAFEKMGIRIAIDDFGTGYSSLSYLKRFPIDTLKIDRSFVRDVTTDADDAAIVSAIIAMATQLNIDIVAEGVETKEQLDFVNSQNCNVIQGFLFSVPLHKDEMDSFLERFL